MDVAATIHTTQLVKMNSFEKMKCLQLKYSDPTFNSISVARSQVKRQKEAYGEWVVISKDFSIFGVYKRFYHLESSFINAVKRSQ